MKKKVVVTPYNPSWPHDFERLKSIFEKAVGEFLIDIQHVGSTSVPGLAAKPIIDIDLIVEDSAKMQKVIDGLKTIGYKHRGDLGIMGREAFKKNEDLSTEAGNQEKWPDHNLYACIEGIPALQNHLYLRDYLRQHPEDAKAYGQLKTELAKTYPDDIDSYIEKKTAFIISILAKTDFSKNELESFIQQNKKNKKPF